MGLVGATAEWWLMFFAFCRRTHYVFEPKSASRIKKAGSLPAFLELIDVITSTLPW